MQQKLQINVYLWYLGGFQANDSNTSLSSFKSISLCNISFIVIELSNLSY